MCFRIETFFCEYNSVALGISLVKQIWDTKWWGLLRLHMLRIRGRDFSEDRRSDLGAGK